LTLANEKEAGSDCCQPLELCFYTDRNQTKRMALVWELEVQLMEQRLQ
jgi:hypothetical protein